MASTRHIPDPLLDAARDTVLAVGLRRATLTDVARRAGVSRMTVYRHAPDISALLLALVTREFAQLLTRSEVGLDPALGARGKLAVLAGRVVAGLPEEPLFARVVEVDPELLIPYLTTRRGATQQAAEAVVSRLIEQGFADGTVAPCDPPARARALVVALTAFTVNRSMRTPQLAGEVQTLVDRWLAPAQL
jgi:AcrR family transcriptional regulator